MPTPITDTRAWKSIDPVRFNSQEDRSNENLLATLAQFSVATNPRYQRRDGNTYCFTYVWDGTKALMCEVPHWADLSSGKKTPDGKGTELNINAGINWLRMFGINEGWMKCGVAKAVERALHGYPTIVAWQNEHGEHGHVAFVVGGTQFSPRIIQAGATNGEMALVQGFGNAGPLEFWTHD